MKAEIINTLTTAWEVLHGNSRFMSWNLFLALIPLAISFWLFERPRSLFLKWGVLLLVGATFVPNTKIVVANVVALMRGEAMTYVVMAIAITIALMVLNLLLLRRRQSPSLVWWLGFLIFIAFLPNSPYVLTDIIHLYRDVRQSNSVWVLTLAVVPQYLLFMFIGFEAYVLSLINFGHYLQRQGWGKYIFGCEFLIHALCAIGIHLGRFQRFNSWDLITNPDALVNTVLNDLIDKRPMLVMFVTFIVISVWYLLMKLITSALIQKYQINKQQGKKFPGSLLTF